MIQLRKKLSAPAPNKLITTGVTKTNALKEAYDNGVRYFEFDSNLYGHSQVKNSLIALQYGKCGFCESKIMHIDYGDVEHFRPKGGWIQEDETLNTPGYYWLAYDWDNLFLACKICNQPNKKNFFPLIDNKLRALSHNHNLELENPLFIHLAKENPEDFIEFVEEVPRAVNNNVRGEKTIKLLGIDRDVLNERRREKLNPIRDLYNLAKGIPETNEEILKAAWLTVKKYFDKSAEDETEYASMLRCFFKANPLPNKP